MNTKEIMGLANELAGFEETPLDSKIYVPGNNIKKILIGIDIGAGELLMAKNLGYDLVIAHHPVSVAGKYQVYAGHFDHMVAAGVPEEEARRAVDARFETLGLADHVFNHDHVSSSAELLQMPFMNIHQACDEMGRRILQETIDAQLQANPDSTLGQVVEALKTLPEFETALTDIKILMGSPDTRAGKVKVAHGAYTNGGYEVATAYFKNGIGTVAYIHVMAEHLKKLREDNLGNLIVTGHIVSDEIGINPLIDALVERGMEVHPISGLRHRRMKH